LSRANKNQPNGNIYIYIYIYREREREREREERTTAKNQGNGAGKKYRDISDYLTRLCPLRCYSYPSFLYLSIKKVFAISYPYKLSVSSDSKC
jgi:hypothetical protein